jgi:hypothetical protein
VGAGVLFGVLPAALGPGRDIVAALSVGGRGTAPQQGLARRVLVVAEVALAMLIASGAALLVRSVAKMYALDPG